MTQPDEPTLEIDNLMTKSEVAQMLGITETWLDSEIQAGNIAHLRLGKRKFIRFRRSHVAEYLAERERPMKSQHKEGGSHGEGGCPRCTARDASADGGIPGGSVETAPGL